MFSFFEPDTSLDLPTDTPQMEIRIDTWMNHDCTIGRLTMGDFKCFTLELPWLENNRRISCIPSGSYLATHYRSPSKGNVLLLHDVPNRTYIEVHAGNFTYQTNGCILVGDSIRHLNNDDIPDVANSKKTLEMLLARVPEQGAVISISRI